MTIKRYEADKDNTLINALRENLTSRGHQANLGASDILEIFSIHAQASTSSLEQARVIAQFPVSSISSDRSSGVLPASGSVKFKFKMYNTPHGQTTPEDFVISVHPLVRAWNEGDGLDMESYLNTEASNWMSASASTPWHTTGSDFMTSQWVSNSANVPVHYTQSMTLGTEDVDINVTSWTEEWLRTEAGNAVPATASIDFTSNPSVNQTLQVYSHEGQRFKYTFINTTTYSVGNDVFLQLSASRDDTVAAINKRITEDFGGKITTNLAANSLGLTQSLGGINGNTIISSSMPDGVATIAQFEGGLGLPNYGVVVKLSGSFEDGSLSRSYYTKKFYARSSHEFFLKPKIEAQWDDSIKDDRSYIVKSSSLSPGADNLNNIYLYNRRRGSLVDIPNTGSYLVVRLHSPVANTAAQATLRTDSGVLGTSTLILTNADETTHTITAASLGGGAPSTATQINTDLVGNANDFATQLKVSLDAAATAGSINMTVSAVTNDSSGQARVITLTQTTKGSSGATSISGTMISGNKLIVNNTTSGGSHGTQSFLVDGDASAQTLTEAGGVHADALTYITASRHSAGVYKAQFAYEGTHTSLYDSWLKSASGTTTELHTGSAFSVNVEKSNSSYEIPDYLLNITNLKDSYLQTEKTTLRVYTRDKNWQPNIYTKASQTAPVNTIRDLYYKIVRVSDNYKVIPYSTGSTPSYTSLSYDVSGSFFDLDMSLLEPNNAYEISFVSKDGSNYIEQQEKFKFRVDP